MYNLLSGINLILVLHILHSFYKKNVFNQHKGRVKLYKINLLFNVKLSFSVHVTDYVYIIIVMHVFVLYIYIYNIYVHVTYIKRINYIYNMLLVYIYIKKSLKH